MTGPTVVAGAAAAPVAPVASLLKVRVFVDYWNFQLSMNGREARLRRVPDYRFHVDWGKLGPWLARQACDVVGVAPANHTFEGVIIYTSYDPRGDTSFRRFVQGWLARQPGVRVECRERRPKGNPKCSACHREITDCPNCNQRLSATVEKGVDTLIATDMIRLAWEGAYDVAVLATSDSDLVPAVEFLNQRGRKVVQAGFPPVGIDLARACWGSFDVFSRRKEIERPPKAGPP